MISSSIPLFSPLSIAKSNVNNTRRKKSYSAMLSKSGERGDGYGEDGERSVIAFPIALSTGSLNSLML